MGARIDLEFLKMFADDWFLLSDMADFFIGDAIGAGCHRCVYEFTMDETLVIKIDRSKFFCNVAEYDIWSNLEDTEYAKFLAPCIRISACGRFMLQKKTQPITREQLPKEIPDFFMDYKIQNWGLLDGQPVCHDYSNHRFYKTSRIGTMEPEWWSDSWQRIDAGPGDPEGYKKV